MLKMWLAFVAVVLILVFFIYWINRRNSIGILVEEISKREFNRLASKGVKVGEDGYLLDTYGDRSNAFVDMVSKNKYDIIRPHVLNRMTNNAIEEQADLDDMYGTTIPRTVSKRPCPFLKQAAKVDLPNNGAAVVDLNVPLQYENV